MNKLLLLLIVCLSSITAFAENNQGKLYIYPQSPQDAVYVDHLLVGQGDIQIEALEAGEYQVQINDPNGKKAFEQKTRVNGKQTTIVRVGELQIFKPAVQYTPTVSLSLGYSLLSLSGNFAGVGQVSNAQLQTYGLFPNVVGIEINKDLTDSLEIQLKYSSYGGKLIAANASADVNISALGVGIRQVWESNNWLRVNYLGIGMNSTNWNGMGSGNGYQLFYGGYTDPQGHLGALQTEIGLTSMGSSSSDKSANGLYIKAGWAF